MVVGTQDGGSTPKYRSEVFVDGRGSKDSPLCEGKNHLTGPGLGRNGSGMCMCQTKKKESHVGVSILNGPNFYVWV